MKEIWTNSAEEFETEEDARDNAWTEITWDDIEEYFSENVNFHDFFTKVREKMPDFFDTFEDEYCDAVNAYFNDNYWTEEVEEDEDEQRLNRYSFLLNKNNVVFTLQTLNLTFARKFAILYTTKGAMQDERATAAFTILIIVL